MPANMANSSFLSLHLCVSYCLLYYLSVSMQGNDLLLHCLKALQHSFCQGSKKDEQASQACSGR